MEGPGAGRQVSDGDDDDVVYHVSFSHLHSLHHSRNHHHRLKIYGIGFFRPFIKGAFAKHEREIQNME